MSDIVSNAALTGMMFTMAAEAAEQDSVAVAKGELTYSKDELSYALASTAKLLDQATQTILSLLDELNPKGKLSKED